jgi:hypothetical protein
MLVVLPSKRTLLLLTLPRLCALAAASLTFDARVVIVIPGGDALWSERSVLKLEPSVSMRTRVGESRWNLNTESGLFVLLTLQPI